MRDTGRRDHPRAFQFQMRCHVLEQADPFTQEDGGKVNLDFIKQPGVEILLSNIRTSRYPDVFLTRYGSCLCQSTDRTICDEDKRSLTSVSLA
jgi:hypothetical protein